MGRVYAWLVLWSLILGCSSDLKITTAEGDGGKPLQQPLAPLELPMDPDVKAADASASTDGSSPLPTEEIPAQDLAGEVMNPREDTALCDSPGTARRASMRRVH